MKTSGMLCAAAVFVALGCHAPTKEMHWRRTGDSAEPLDTARVACKAEAIEQGNQTANEGMAAKQLVGVFADCMRRHGWEPAEGSGQ